MTISVKVPTIGESITEGVIAAWLKSDGDYIQEDEPLFELETEKATQEIPSPASGIVCIAVSEGETVAIGDEVAKIEPGEKPAEVSVAAKTSARETTATTNDTGKSDSFALSPAVRHLAEEKSIDVSKVHGTGRGGRITKEDVLAYVNDGQSAVPKDGVVASKSTEPRNEKPVPSATGGIQRQPLSALRQRIAQRLVSSQQSTATLTTFNEADMSAVLELRRRFKDRFKEKHDVGLGFMSFFVKACVEALKAFPQVNGCIDGNEIVTYDHHNIGVAVSAPKGLMVPIVRDAGNLSFAEIEKTIADLATQARDGKIRVEDLQGGTFTITNGGVFGSLLSTPILYPGQSGILGMHTIQKRPVVVNDEIVIRPMMYLALSYDHRLIDGREAVQFLIRVKECTEDPERMLLEV